MKIIEIMMAILSICVSILAITGTMVVLILCAKAFYENFLEFLKCRRARKKADKLDNFHLMSLDDAIKQCQDKKNNSFCGYDERQSYKYLQIWLIELKQFREKDKMKDIEFVSYNGKYPNLCSGVLTLRVDGQIRQFDRCLISGGGCNVCEDSCTIGEWDINDDVFSEFTENEKKFIRLLVNENVEKGCCGGCL